MFGLEWPISHWILISLITRISSLCTQSHHVDQQPERIFSLKYGHVTTASVVMDVNVRPIPEDRVIHRIRTIDDVYTHQHIKLQNIRCGYKKLPMTITKKFSIWYDATNMPFSPCNPMTRPEREVLPSYKICSTLHQVFEERVKPARVCNMLDTPLFTTNSEWKQRYAQTLGLGQLSQSSFILRGRSDLGDRIFGCSDARPYRMYFVEFFAGPESLFEKQKYSLWGCHRRARFSGNTSHRGHPKIWTPINQTLVEFA